MLTNNSVLFVFYVFPLTFSYNGITKWIAHHVIMFIQKHSRKSAAHVIYTYLCIKDSFSVSNQKCVIFSFIFIQDGNLPLLYTPMPYKI